MKNSFAVISDNYELLLFLIELLKEEIYSNWSYKFFCSHLNNNKELLNLNVVPIDISENVKYLESNFEFVLSIHAKQIFPKQLVENTNCFNLHPGLIPYNRGWFPHVFSIINKMPCGATLHKMTDKIDFGDIIDQVEVKIEPWDTSLTLYNKIIIEEKKLLKKNLIKLLQNNYDLKKIVNEGTYNSKKKYEQLKELDLNRMLSIGETINLLRALSHPPYKNAYFIDYATKKKIYVEIKLTIDDLG